MARKGHPVGLPPKRSAQHRVHPSSDLPEISICEIKFDVIGVGTADGRSGNAESRHRTRVARQQNADAGLC
jgi:hypothetical protein